MHGNNSTKTLSDYPNFTSKEVFRSNKPGRRNSIYLLLAAAWHLLITISIYLTGRFALWPQMFDSNGIGLPFAADCLGYRIEAISFIRVLSHEGIANWLNASSQYVMSSFHIKLYSLSFALLGPLVGYNILAAEPLNLLCYLSTLYLVFALGRETFDERAGLVAAGIVALWPSFLLHTTQLFKDPLFIAAMLFLILICLRWLTREHSWLQGLAAGVLGAGLAFLILLLRREMWEVVLAVVLLGAGLLILKQIRKRRTLIGNILNVFPLLIMLLSLPYFWRTFYPPSQTTDRASVLTENGERNPTQTDPIVPQRQPPGSSLPARINEMRRGFLIYQQAGSNWDADVELNSTVDIIRYLPRAAAIGFFAPFPRMWFVAGAQVGLKGRLLSGLETLMMYLIQVCAAWTLWRHRRELPVWYLLLSAGVGLTALGLVVANIGTMYRMRYTYWILLIVIGAEGVLGVYGWAKKTGQSSVRSFASH